MRVPLGSAGAVLACAVIALAGCAGGGGTGPTVPGAGEAPGQGASILFVQEWSQVLWGLVAAQTGTQPPTVGPPVQNPDGTVSQTFTGADGTETVLTVWPDGSARLDITYPDRTTQTVTASAPDPPPPAPKYTVKHHVDTSTGLKVDYDSVTDDRGTPFDMRDDSTHLTGKSTLPNLDTQQFTVHTEGGKTVVQGSQSDGSTFVWEVPLAGPTFEKPDFSREAQGAYRRGGLQIDFTLGSTPADRSRWTKMSSALGRDMEGQFSLGGDFSGSGRLLQRGKVIAALSWTQHGRMEIRYVSASSSAANPAGAALDYLTNRWQTLAGLLF